MDNATKQHKQALKEKAMNDFK